MEESLPTLRRLGDQRCTGRALHVLGEHAFEHGQLARAAELLGAGVEAIALAGQSFVMVNVLEALAGVRCAQDRPRHAAVLLGTARSARDSASMHMRPVQVARAAQLRRTVVLAIGASAYDAAHREGEHLSPQQALLSAAP